MMTQKSVKQKKLTLDKKAVDRVNKMFFDKRNGTWPVLTKSQGQYKNYSCLPCKYQRPTGYFDWRWKTKLDRENRQA